MYIRKMKRGGGGWRRVCASKKQSYAQHKHLKRFFLHSLFFCHFIFCCNASFEVLRRSWGYVPKLRLCAEKSLNLVHCFVCQIVHEMFVQKPAEKWHFHLLGRTRAPPRSATSAHTPSSAQPKISIELSTADAIDAIPQIAKPKAFVWEPSRWSRLTFSRA